MMFAAECSDFGDACVPVTEWSWEFPFALAVAVLGAWLVVRDRRRWPDTESNNVYNVWVGGVLDAEGVDYFTAVEVSDDWMAQGYDDVVIELSQD